MSKADVVEQVGRAASAPQAPAGRSAPAAQVAAGAQPAPARGPTPNGGRTPPASGGPRETREKMTTRRKRIAENLVQAQHTTAHLTTFNEIDMSAVSALRERLRERVEREQGVRLSFMPFFVKAACVALQQYPVVNAQIEGDSIVYKHYVNMGIAVASDQGLVVPVIRDADAKGMLDIAREITELAARARAAKLAVDELMGGTFTITNGGVFGSLVSTPILNYPQVGILGLHKIQDRPIALGGAGRDPTDDVRGPLLRPSIGRWSAGRVVPPPHQGADGRSGVDARDVTPASPTATDVVVIGGGPGGYVAAIRAAQLGLTTVCVEQDKTLGGTCVNVGCIPSKALLTSSEHFEFTKLHASEHGFHAAVVTLDLPRMMKRKDDVVAQNTKGIEFLFRKNKITWAKGRGVLRAEQSGGGDRQRRCGHALSSS